MILCRWYSNSLANKVNHLTNKKIFTMGLSNKSAGFLKKVDNLPPNADNLNKIFGILNNAKK